MFAATTRRRLLGGLAGAAGAALAPRLAPAQPRDAKTGAGLRVSLHEPGGAHLRGPALVSVATAGGATIVLQRGAKELTYFADLPAGSYRLRVTTDGSGFANVEQDIRVPAQGLSLPVYLGKPGWPSFQWGQSVIPFEPRENLCAVAFVGARPARAAKARVLESMRGMGLTPFPSASGFFSHGDTIALFRWAGATPGPFFGAERRNRPDFVARVASALNAFDVRVGMPIDTRPGHLKILDNRYVVRTVPSLTSVAVSTLARKYGSSTRPVDGLDDTWLFEFSHRSDYRSHLESVRKLLRSDDGRDVRYIEPSLIFDLQQHACADAATTATCSATEEAVPLDPWGICEQTLTLQEVTQAWCFLEQRLGAPARFGSGDVCIATVDAAGINKEHPDAAGVEYVSLCADCAEMPEDDHGMSVFGIVSARPGNGSGTTGIAPGTHHVAVRPQRQWSDPPSYAQMIRWVSGVAFASNVARPLGRAAAVVVCSHGLADLPTPSAVSDAFVAVTDQGRVDPATGRKLGTVLVYSAGNADTDISGTQGFAAHPRVIAVGNTMLPDRDPAQERRDTHSNYGFDLSLCAQGELAPSLLANPASSLPGTCVPPRGNTTGAGEFGGTSAACPMVGATAALMLSVNPGLTWLEVGDRLRASARCVDPADPFWSGHRNYFYGYGRLNTYEAVKAAAPSA